MTSAVVVTHRTAAADLSGNGNRPNLWRRRLKTGLPPPPLPQSSLPHCLAGRPLGLGGGGDEKMKVIHEKIISTVPGERLPILASTDS